jgi:hypothetical protein
MMTAADPALYKMLLLRSCCSLSNGALKILLLRSIHITRTDNEGLTRPITCTAIALRVRSQNHAGPLWPSHQLPTHFYY